MTASQNGTIRKAQLMIDTHSLQLCDFNRHMEDLENRGRRHNLKLRGLPEMIDSNHLKDTVVGLFNDLLNRTPTTPIGMERIHQALYLRGKKSDPPRNVIFHIIDYQLKEEILRKARLKKQLSFNGAEIHLFQDLSTIILQCHRELKPVLEVLRAKGIPHR